MAALEHDLQHTETRPIFADIVAERGRVRRNFPKLGRKFRCRQLGGRMVAILMQHQSVDHATGIAREADGDTPSLAEKLVGRRRKDGEGFLSGGAGKQPIVQEKHRQEELVGKLVGSLIVGER